METGNPTLERVSIAALIHESEQSRPIPWETGARTARMLTSLTPSPKATIRASYPCFVKRTAAPRSHQSPKRPILLDTVPVLDSFRSFLRSHTKTDTDYRLAGGGFKQTHRGLHYRSMRSLETVRRGTAVRRVDAQARVVLARLRPPQQCVRKCASLRIAHKSSSSRPQATAVLSHRGSVERRLVTPVTTHLLPFASRQ